LYKVRASRVTAVVGQLAAQQSLPLADTVLPDIYLFCIYGAATVLVACRLTGTNLLALWRQSPPPSLQRIISLLEGGNSMDYSLDSLAKVLEPSNSCFLWITCICVLLCCSLWSTIFMMCLMPAIERTRRRVYGY